MEREVTVIVWQLASAVKSPVPLCPYRLFDFGAVYSTRLRDSAFANIPIWVYIGIPMSNLPHIKPLYWIEAKEIF